MDLAERIVAAVAAHPAVRDMRLAGSRAEGRATERSDWDFRVETSDFAAVADALPRLLAPLEPLAQQWDRLSAEYCWMLMLRGPVKVDLIFVHEPHTDEPPWRPRRDNLAGIDAHFWDWMLWLRGKEVAGKADLVATHLQKVFDHLLAPLGAERPPSSIREALVLYSDARTRAERRFGQRVSRDLEAEVARVLVD
jgi:predicted nucleotidyltransferase